jgi:hypothetical protein
MKPWQKTILQGQNEQLVAAGSTLLGLAALCVFAWFWPRSLRRRPNPPA